MFRSSLGFFCVHVDVSPMSARVVVLLVCLCLGSGNWVELLQCVQEVRS